MVSKLLVSTDSRVRLVDITSRVREAVAEAAVGSGTCLVFVTHTTAGVTINENADPSVSRDIETTLSRLVPPTGDYLHAEGNSDAHVKAGLVGFSLQLIVEDDQPVLGVWQAVYLAEFDGPRQRTVLVKVVADD